jgi:hypothetical protein
MKMELFPVTISVQLTGTYIKIISIEGGNESDAVSVQVKDGTPPKQPLVNIVNNKSTVIAGKTDPAALVMVKLSAKTYNGKADELGNFAIAIPIQNSGTTLTVMAKDTAGNISAACSVTVARVAPNIPVINPVRYYSTAVTGKTERYAVVSVKIGAKVYSAKADYNGNFKVYIPKQRTGTKLAVTAKDAKGLISAARMVTVY